MAVKKGEAGFTLVEMLVSLALASLIVTGLMSVYWSGNNSFTRQSANSEAQYGARSAMQRVIKDVRIATVAPVVLEDNTKLVLTQASGNVEYYRNPSNNNLYRSSGGTAVPVAEDISYLHFSDSVSPLKIIIEATVQNKPYRLSSSVAYRVGGNAVPEDSFINYMISKKVFLYSSQFAFKGDTINGLDSTMIINGDYVFTKKNENGGYLINVQNIYVDGSFYMDEGSASIGSTSNTGSTYVNGDLTLWSGSRNVYGNVYVAGNLRLKDAKIHGNVYVDGNLELGWTPTIDTNSRIYYTGTFTYPQSMSTNITSKCIKQTSVPGFSMPAYTMPVLKADSWYVEKGYVSGGSLSNGIKIFSNNYSSNDWKDASNVVIVSKGDISLTGSGSVSGILFAPNGSITFGRGSFEGVIIAGEGFSVTSGGSTIKSNIISNYFSNPSDYPF
jgi:prepilin-type N-terminal cleavage/methylation domain-containing protein